MNRRLLLVVTGWLTVGLIATGAGLTLTTLLGETITELGSRPLSADEVQRALDASDAAATSPSTVLSPSPTAPAQPRSSEPPRMAGTPRVMTLPGGVVVARCSGGLVTLESLTPAPGYEIDDADRGPRDRARVKFESEEGHGRKSEIEVRCSGDRPEGTIKDD
ncbi:hypothetical protein GCM10023194_35430 [Planotetraspora phitsanulokensis]|uniref:Septum formation initiator n=1 Tax=Planotetraspora phitsanulokensis TaxID=575192 RepID=A0A8J3U5D0_9ACTN|nr:hypothetical protein [Planotetraspora phitsanulokensis]GII36329.1 hypothetical protein Pph01_13320 [Planotetraspora phitsanulokensis]